ncbi:efflux RND transporter periplasmic adaptor subunit [Pseudomonas sp. s4]|uniref:efflux RND transporter periplasmic adaptor subunit n=1 Tax=Pseudomonas sp. s4 TaxID=353218 RepID=UPI00398CA4F4
MALNSSIRASQALVPLTLAALLVGCGKQEAAQPPAAPQVGVYQVHAQRLLLSSDLPGRTSAYRVAEVRPQVSGVIQKRTFVEGSEVKQGQALYQIDPRTYNAQQARAEANLRTTGNLAQRYQRLLQTNAISQQQFDDAQAAWLQAQADAQVARINVQYTQVLSPISGRIGRSSVTEGALVTNGQAQELATVTQLDPIYVDVTQPITKLLGLQRALAAGHLQNGESQTEVGLSLDDGSAYPLKGTLKFSEVRVDPTTGSVTLRAEFPNPQRTLLPGMFVRAQINEGVDEAALLVPQQAVVRDTRGQSLVWLVTAGNQVEQREVQTVRTVGNAWLIGKGLNDGDRVVTEGLQRLSKGIQVEPVEASNVQLVSDFTGKAQAAN